MLMSPHSEGSCQVFFEGAEHSNVSHLEEVRGVGGQVEVNIVRHASSGIWHMA